MNPSPQAIARISAYVATLPGGWSEPDATILGMLNAVPAQGQVPVVLTETALLGKLTDPQNGSAKQILMWPNLGLLKADIEANNHGKVLAWAASLPIAGLITAAESAAITAYVNSTVPDPSWSSTATWAEVWLGRAADEDDVAQARAAGGH